MGSGAADALSANAEVEWVQADMVSFRSSEPFDGAICMLQAFGLHELDADAVARDAAYLQQVHGCLKPNAPFMLHVTNALRLVREMDQKEVDEGRLNTTTMCSVGQASWDTPDGTRSVQVGFSNWTPSEIALFASCNGFTVENVWSGDKLASGPRPVQLDDYMIMVSARRAPEGKQVHTAG